jgi:NADH dehydrogenase
MASSSGQSANGQPPTHAVIVGGGFAGLGCARELAGEDSVRVTLVDQHNYHQFQPLLYQVATSQLAATSIASSLRKAFHEYPNVDVKLGEVIEVDPTKHAVRTREGDTIVGDVVVLAAGARANFFNTPGAAEHAFPLYSLTMPSSCARGCSLCSRMPIATTRSSTGAR